MSDANQPLCKLRMLAKTPGRRRLLQWLEPVLEPLLAIDEMNQLHALVQRTDAPMAQTALSYLRTEYELPPDDLQRIPSSGPVIVAANHPFGALEALILADLLAKVRPDARIMANFLVGRVDGDDLFLYVDPFRVAQGRNHAATAKCLRHVSDGGLLAVFPAGVVAQYQMRCGRVTDGPWNPSFVRMALRSQATIVPVYFDGRNSLVFQFLSLLHNRLRVGLLPRELMNKREMLVQVRIGRPLPPQQLAKLPTLTHQVAYVRARTYLQAQRLHRRLPSLPLQDEVPVIDAVAPALLRQDLDALGPERTLDSSGSIRVIHALAGEIPNVMREIGRLREITFRQAGGWTGNEIDLDRFDDYYRHLVLWDDEANAVAGAYRLGDVAAIRDSHGVDGLYTYTQFEYFPQMLDEIESALELGRSFVRQEYQVNSAALLLLWRGIGRYLVANPRFEKLFGVVTVSTEYTSVSQQLMVSFLQVNYLIPGLARAVRARHPMQRQSLDLSAAELTQLCRTDVNVLNDLVAEFEPDGKRMPVLLRQYLKLGARLIGVNRDPKCSNVLHVLMMVDALKIEANRLKTYMGADGFADYCAYHQARRAATTV